MSDNTEQETLLKHFEPWTQTHATQWRSGFGLVWTTEGRWYYNAIKPSNDTFDTREDAMRACEAAATKAALNVLIPLTDAAARVLDCDGDIGYVLQDRKDDLLNSCFIGVLGPINALQTLVAPRLASPSRTTGGNNG